jgi:glutathione S-transferase
MILVGQYDSPFVRRVAISLRRLNLPFTRNTLSVFGDADAMRKINPLGRIPSLVLNDGEVLIDSAAILDHLDELVGPSRALMPRFGRERRRALRITALATGGVEKAGAIVYERMLRPADKQHTPWIERNVTQLEAALAALEVLPQTPWLMGANLMQPDISTACLISYLKLRGGEAFIPARYPNLATLADAAEALPEFIATRAADNETMPAAAP